jgi:hypothetical protein
VYRRCKKTDENQIPDGGKSHEFSAPPAQWFSSSESVPPESQADDSLPLRYIPEGDGDIQSNIHKFSPRAPPVEQPGQLS